MRLFDDFDITLNCDDIQYALHGKLLPLGNEPLLKTGCDDLDLNLPFLRPPTSERELCAWPKNVDVLGGEPDPGVSNVSSYVRRGAQRQDIASNISGDRTVENMPGVHF